ncbi:MAG: protein kinase [Myxococcales bacterium]|nr:protein kinase [Myxococcales bacterium]
MDDPDLAGDALRLFDAVVDLPYELQQTALASRCSGRPSLEAMVRAMLQADRASRGPLATGAAEELLARDILAAEGARELPEQVGDFRILSLLGSGGMGAVYEAEQMRPRRRVALKTIHPWLVSETTRAWLLREAQALGSVLHPGIPQVYAVGGHEDLLFVAMEQVEGTDLLQAVAHLDVPGRVRLVAELCDAVAHVHGRGLVHRDLKPANVRVTPSGQPKLLDFGLSRPPDTAPEARVVGTLAYLAPELRRGPAPPDVRADVYAMGVLLHEVLRGDLPCGPSLPTLGEHTSTPVLPLDDGRADLSGDLACIVAKAVAQDPDERYGTVAQLGAELERSLRNEPVLAHRGGWVYTLGKWVRRHPAWTTVAVLVVVSLLLLTGVSVVFARQQAEARAVAEAEAARSRALATFMSSVFFSANPRKATGDRTLLDVTRSAAEELDAGGLADHPTERGELRNTIGQALYNVEDRHGALAQFQSVVDAHEAGVLPAGAVVVDALHGVSIVQRRLGEIEISTAALERAIAMAERLDLELELGDLVHSKAQLLWRAGQLHEVEPLLRRAIALKREPVRSGRVSVDYLTNSINQLGRLYLETGRAELAEPLFLDALEQDREALGSDHVELGIDHMWCAEAANALGRPASAAVHARQGIAIQQAVLPLGDLSLLNNRQALLRALLDLGELQEADALLTQLVGDRLGAWEPPLMGIPMASLAAELRALQGRDDEALELAEIAVRKAQAWRFDHIWATARLARGRVHAEAGRHELARADLETLRREVARHVGPGSHYVRRASKILESLPR